MPPIPTPVQLDPPGPYETPNAVLFLGAADATTLEPARFRFLLQNGTELRVPMVASAVEALRVLLQDSSPEHPDIPEIGE